MKKTTSLLFCFLIISSNLKASSFSTPTSIPNAQIADNSYNITSSYNSLMNQVVFQWANNDDDLPYYTIYNATTGSFTIPAAIPGAAAVINPIASCYNSHMNQVVFSWRDNASNLPYYTIYDAATGAFTTPAAIPGASASFSSILSSYNSHMNQVVFSWINNADHIPYYTIYDATTGSFTTPTAIPNASAANSAIFSCYNSHMNQVVFSWVNSLNSLPYYTIYDATTGSFTTPTAIPNASAATTSGIIPCYNSLMNQVVFSWIKNSNSLLYYAIYDATTGSFTTPTAIPNAPTAGSYTISSCYNSLMNQVVFSWHDNTSNLPYYVIYDAATSTFTNPTFLPDAQTANRAVYSSYNSNMNQVVFSWIDDTSYLPYYEIYTQPLPPAVASNRLINASRKGPIFAQKGNMSTTAD